MPPFHFYLCWCMMIQSVMYGALKKSDPSDGSWMDRLERLYHCSGMMEAVTSWATSANPSSDTGVKMNCTKLPDSVTKVT